VQTRRVVRLIQKWLSVGVLEDGEYEYGRRRDAPGGSASPLLANVYLHSYSICGSKRGGQKRGTRRCYTVVASRMTSVVGFHSKADADQFRANLPNE